MNENNQQNKINELNDTTSISKELKNELRYKIWDIYYYISLTTLQLFSVDEDNSNSKKNIVKIFLTFVPNIIAVLLLLVRAIYMLIRMSTAISLSLYWTYSGILFFISLHGLIGALALLVYKTQKYFTTTCVMLSKASKSTLSSAPKGQLIFTSLIYLYVIGPSLYCILENYIMFNHDITDVINLNQTYHNITSNLTAQFRKSIFGHHSLYVFDSILILLGAYCAANALVVYLLANRALCREYENFNKQLKNSIDDESILNLSVIRSYESQLIDYMSTARFITNTAAFLLDVTFMAALFIQISAQFALKSFGSNMSGIQIALFSIWIAQSITFLVLSTKRPGMFYNLLKETSTMLWLDQGIWCKCDDLYIRDITRSITQRIEAVDYASKGLSPIRSANCVFNTVLFIIPFFVDILSGNKFIPFFINN